MLDLTADGRADSVRLDAAGASPDSLGITLTVIVDGTQRFRERWESSYELALLDSAARAGGGIGDTLRGRLDRVLASVTVRRVDAPSVELMAEDSVMLAGIVPMPPEVISFSYGYETTIRLVWDSAHHRFVPLWSCC